VESRKRGGEGKSFGTRGRPFDAPGPEKQRVGIVGRKSILERLVRFVFGRETKKRLEKGKVDMPLFSQREA